MNEDQRIKFNEIKNKLQIDPFDLETECVNQPILYELAGELATDSKAEAKKSKELLDLTRADLSSKIRKDPESYGISKVTEASIESAIVLRDEYQAAMNNSIEAQRTADAFGVLLTSLEQRKSMIKDLVTLYVYKYYSNMQNMESDASAMGPVTQDQIVARRRQLAESRGMNRFNVEEEQE